MISAFALTVAFSVTSSNPPAPLSYADLAFAYALESSIARAAHTPIARSSRLYPAYDRVLSPPSGSLIRRLSCGHYECRRHAEDELRSFAASDPIGAARLAAWATVWGDPDAGASAARVMAEVGRCRACKGTGGWRWQGDDEPGNCQDCGGVGRIKLQGW